jgi:NAD(P)-dependent dehydrogenase (short-subunit alcohol dehydrogenase family)
MAGQSFHQGVEAFVALSGDKAGDRNVEVVYRDSAGADTRCARQPQQQGILASYREAAIASRALPRDGWRADIVGGVAFLSSDDASFISVQKLAVDGGSVHH